MSEAAIDARPRYHALDALRGGAMLLGIVLHASMSFAEFPFDIPWPRDTQRSVVLTGAIAGIHLFRLQLFFLVAGFFARMLHERVGLRAFLQHRLRRVGLPLVLGIFTIVPLVGVAMAFSVTDSSSDARAMLREHLASFEVEMAHLWFLYFLLIYYLIAVCCVVPVGRRLVNAGVMGWLDRGYGALIASPIKPLVLALVTLAPMYFATRWHTVGLATHPNVPPRILIYYGIFFAVGWWLHRHVHLLDTLKRFKWSYLLAAAICFVIIVVLSPYEGRPGHPHYAWIELTVRAVANVYTWTMVFAVAGLFLAYLDVSRWYIRYMADASYWFYLAHLPIVVALQGAVADYALSAWVKLGGILMVTLVVLAVTYEYGVRYTWIGTMLNGKRERAANANVATAEG